MPERPTATVNRTRASKHMIDCSPELTCFAIREDFLSPFNFLILSQSFKESLLIKTRFACLSFAVCFFEKRRYLFESVPVRADAPLSSCSAVQHVHPNQLNRLLISSFCRQCCDIREIRCLFTLYSMNTLSPTARLLQSTFGASAQVQV